MFFRWRSDSDAKRQHRYGKKDKSQKSSGSNNLAGGSSYNWTEIERYDTTDLQLRLQDLEPFTKYEILLQAYNQFGRGPVAKIEVETQSDGKKKLHLVTKLGSGTIKDPNKIAKSLHLL